jgi:hypothetical protein
LLRAATTAIVFAETAEAGQLGQAVGGIFLGEQKDARCRRQKNGRDTENPYDPLRHKRDNLNCPLSGIQSYALGPAHPYRHSSAYPSAKRLVASASGKTSSRRGVPGGNGSDGPWIVA